MADFEPTRRLEIRDVSYVVNRPLLDHVTVTFRAGEVTALSGAGTKPFARELLRFTAFEKSFPGGVSVAAAQFGPALTGRR